MDPRVKKLAQVIARYSLGLKKGQVVQIVGEPAALPLIKAMNNEVIDLGAQPVVDLTIPDNEEYMLKHGSDQQLKFLQPWARLRVSKIDAYVVFLGGENTRYLASVDPRKQAQVRLNRKKIMDLFYRRVEKKELRWCLTLFPTISAAQEADMSLTDYEDFVYGAGHLGATDPVKHWLKVRKEQARLVKILNRIDQLHFRAEGTDLKLRVKGRKWVNCAGENNFPDGEIFTGPIENSAEGKIRYTFPAIFMGKEVEDITLTFKKGKVVNFGAAKNEAYLKSMIELDRGAKYIGEVAIGTNYDIKTFTKNILFDEKLGGTCHLALGNSFAETGSKNKSSLHWDMICDLKKGGEIIADGKTIYRNGKFLV